MKRVGTLLALAWLGLATAGVALSGAGSPRPHWVGAWLASPSDPSAFQKTLRDQTLRMIVAPHLSGSRLRIHLSNRFGAGPVTLGPVTVALRGRGASVAAGTLRQVTFGGHRTVTIPAHGGVISDAVGVRVAPFRDLAVSIDVPGSVTAPTEHFSTRQTSYLSPLATGDHAADVSGRAYTLTTGRAGYSTGWYFLSGIDVQAAPAVTAVVAFGDSITDGYQGNAASGGEQLGTINVNGRWPDDLQRRVNAKRLPVAVLNAGISGNRVLSPGLIPMFGPSGLSRLRTDALSVPGVRDVIVLEGINDLGENAKLTAGSLITGYRKLIAMAHRDRVRIQLGTITPAEGSAQLSYGTTATDRTRNAVNRWIRTQRFSDGYVDFDGAVRDPANPGRIRSAYDGSDHLHFNLAGYRAMARTVDLTLLTGTR